MIASYRIDRAKGALKFPIIIFYEIQPQKQLRVMMKFRGSVNDFSISISDVIPRDLETNNFSRAI